MVGQRGHMGGHDDQISPGSINGLYEIVIKLRCRVMRQDGTRVGIKAVFRALLLGKFVQLRLIFLGIVPLSAGAEAVTPTNTTDAP